MKNRNVFTASLKTIRDVVGPLGKNSIPGATTEKALSHIPIN